MTTVKKKRSSKKKTNINNTKGYNVASLGFSLTIPETGTPFFTLKNGAQK